MKANQAFKAEEEAVSPVVGVILMVAITVVLAAVVFVLVNNLGKSSSKAPDMGFSADNAKEIITVVKAPVAGDAITYDSAAGGDGLFFSSGTSGCVAATVNGATLAATVTANTKVAAGDVITFTGCAAGSVVNAIHSPSGTTVYSTTWTA